jgi:response regulator RpfG family c-di-GMP phosphodiesterase
MIRPCFLVVDREYSGSISTRKLVIETAKFNVLTAYSSAEAIETLERYPRVDGVVIDAGLKDMPCAELVAELRKITPELKIVSICPVGSPNCDGADEELESFDPKKLLGVLQKFVPQATKAIEKREEDLASGKG